MDIRKLERWNQLRIAAVLAVSVLSIKVLLAILLEYRWYFPPDFEASTFLMGRRSVFRGLYRTAFYAHILAGPIVLILGSILMYSGSRSRFPCVHRHLGKLHVVLVIGVLGPSGLVMARHAFAGRFAAFGFASLAVATMVCAATAGFYAGVRQLPRHRRWATRLYILLVSPLIFRIATGVFIVTQLESDETYQLNAWLSWLVPLAIYEFACCRGDQQQPSTVRSQAQSEPI